MDSKKRQIRTRSEILIQGINTGMSNLGKPPIGPKNEIQSLKDS